MMDDEEKLRIDDDEDVSTRSQFADPAIPMGLVVLGRTKSLGSYPSAAGKMFAFEPLAILGTESEGSTASLTALTGTQYAALLPGSAVPAQGVSIIAVYVPYRFVFLY